jgi:hypothetical protein
MKFLLPGDLLCLPGIAVGMETSHSSPPLSYGEFLTISKKTAICYVPKLCKTSRIYALSYHESIKKLKTNTQAVMG